MEFDKQKNDLAANLNEQKQFPNQHKMDSKYLVLNSEVLLVFTFCLSNLESKIPCRQNYSNNPI